MLQFFIEQEKQPEIDNKLTDADLDSITKSIDEALNFAEGQNHVVNFFGNNRFGRFSFTGSMGKLGDLNKEIIVAVENAVTARERAKWVLMALQRQYVVFSIHSDNF